MAEHTNIAILIYASNVEETIAHIVKTCLNASDKVLVADDGSKDATLDRIRELPITVIHNDFPIGKEQCMIRGFTYLQSQRPKAIITIEASEFYYFDKIDAFLEAGLKYPQHVIIGVQTRKNRFANFLVSWLIGERIEDVHSSIRFIPNAVVSQTIQHVPRTNAGILDAKLMIDAKQLGFSFLSAEMVTQSQVLHVEKPIRNTYRFWSTVLLLLVSKAFNPIGLFKAIFSSQQTIQLD